MNKCPGCGEVFRKGKRRMVLQANGELVRQLVCGACVKRSVGIVPSTRATVCTSCGWKTGADAHVCAQCANDMAHHAVRTALGPFVEHLRGLLKAYPNAIGEGIAIAIDILDTARAVPLDTGAAAPSNGEPTAKRATKKAGAS